MKTILFQGDSITDCGRLRQNNSGRFQRIIEKLLKRTALGDGYPALVAEELSKCSDDLNFINKGVSGDRVPDVYARIVRDILYIKPDYISILVGVNDVWHGFDFNNGTGAERYEKVYNMLIEEIKAELPHVKIMILEPFVLKGSATADRAGQPDRFQKFSCGVKQMAEIAKKVADKHNLEFVELQKVFDKASETTAPTLLLSDGVHPTAKGHELIKNEWIKAFDEI